MERVDILIPPRFEKSGEVKTRSQAYQDGNWIGGFNLWIFQTKPVPAIVYQQRSFNSTWEPGKLDLAAAGHYQAGESLLDGLREAEEELGKTYQSKDVMSLGRRLNVSFDTKGFERRNVLDIFYTIDNDPLATYSLEANEVAAICTCPMQELLATHQDPDYSFTTTTYDPEGKKQEFIVSHDSFPKNWDNYHARMAKVLQRLVAGEKNVEY